MDQVYNVDLFLNQLTYLPFKEVINMCQVNTKYHNYCTSNTYNNNWKALIDNTFSNVYNYREKLDKIWQDLGYDQNKYDYMVYTNLVRYLDTITQLMIYYKQKDMDSFNDPKYNNEQRFLALFLLSDKNLIQYLPTPNINLERRAYKGFIDLLNGNMPNKEDLSDMLIVMAKNSNIKGVKYLVDRGANIHTRTDLALRKASNEGHSELVKYLVEQGLDIHTLNESALRSAASNGHLEVVKYLVGQGANIHEANDSAFTLAAREGHLEIVKYLVENGANIHALNDRALTFAAREGHLEIVKYLIDNGANIHAMNDRALMLATERRHMDIIKYLQERM